jgi:MFS transporter, DHA2 family, multidrug resistance protein
MSAAAPKNPSSVAVAEWRPKINPWLTAAAVMLATFMVVLDTSIASVSLPYIAGNLGATHTEATWVLTSCLVSNAIVLPASAWLSRLFGRKRFLSVCIILFTLASAMCGLATSLPMLVVARVLQGIGGGAMQPLAQSILLESFPPNKRGTAMAVYGFGVILAPIMGPALGGWLTDTYSWRWIFLINLPVGVLAVMMVSKWIEDPPYARASRPERIDGIGLGLMVVGLGALQITLDKGQEVDWLASVWLRWGAAIAVLALAGFVVRELTTEHPIVNLRILKNRNFAVGCLLYTMFGAALYALVALQPLFLQTLMGYTALDSGLTVSPRGLGTLIALVVIGPLMGRVSQRLLVAVGFAALGLSALWFSQMTLQVSMASIVPANILNGFGSGFVFVPLTTLALGMLPNEQMADASGLQNLTRNIGGSFGLSFVATMLERFSQAHQSSMVGHMSLLNPVYDQRVGLLQQMFGAHFSPADALHRAQAFLYSRLLQQADYWAYMNLFYVLAGLYVVCTLSVFLLKPVRPTHAVETAIEM